MPTTTIVGGAQVIIPGPQVPNYTIEYNALVAAFDASGDSSAVVLTSLSDAPPPGEFAIYEIVPTAAGQHIGTMPAGGGALIIEDGPGLSAAPDYSNSVDVNSGLLIDNNGNDTINATGNSTIATGSGHNIVNVTGDATSFADITTGIGFDRIDIKDGSVTLTGLTEDRVVLYTGQNTLDGLTATKVDVDGGINVVTVAGGKVEVIGASQDTITTTANTFIKLDHIGNASITLDGTSGDKLVIAAGNNTVVSSSGVAFAVSGGHNTLTLDGPNSVTLIGGVSSVYLGDNSNLVERGGINRVHIAAGDAETIHNSGGIDFLTVTGGDTVNIFQGRTNITSIGVGNVIDLHAGGEDTITGNGVINVSGVVDYTLVVTGNDTINYGSGRDTVIEGGTATVHIANGHITVSSAGGIVTAGSGVGSGLSTLLGGSGMDAGHASVLGGSTNTFVGAGADTLSAAGAPHEFTFSAQSGGTHVIDHYETGRDQINLVGYDTASALHSAKVVGGSTVISLDHGHTTIVLQGFTHLQGSDFSHS